MDSFVFGREKYMLTIIIDRVLDDRYVNLPRSDLILQLLFTNLRNRPLSTDNIDSMRDSILSLYHNLITGCKEYPIIPFKGLFNPRLLIKAFGKQEQRENATPCPLMEAPPGLMVPPADSSFPPPPVMTPPLPEQAELEALKADRRNVVRRMQVDGRTVTRVISPMYRSYSTELKNRWRVSDYREDGQVLMSALCRFPKGSLLCAPTQRRGSKRKDSSSPSPPVKRLRV
ncbi:uncharacterized protein LOC117745925 [Cyclopterus lumpus]|uniref:uncharacterized protein LOC117745925 n=1 Tax=Cyclopterus lumpus TaxID=8103 RepID=UPI00148727C0|nr:uncharacterized protein LOC117745925 [Cyclopterus lumpus]